MTGSSLLRASCVVALLFGAVLLPAQGWTQEPPPVGEPVCADGCPGEGGGDTGGVSTDDPASGQPYIPPDYGMETIFVAASCFEIGPGKGCYNESGNLVAQRISAHVFREVASNAVSTSLSNYLWLRFPNIPSYKVERALFAMEKKVVENVRGEMLSGIRKMSHQMTLMPSEADRQRMRTVIENDTRLVDEWTKAAQKEARRGVNWQKLDASSYGFKPGPAYIQLAGALEGREWFR